MLDNFAPTFTDGVITVRTVTENTAAGENIGTPITAIDTVADMDNAPDTPDDTLTYSLGGIDADAFDIDTETGQLKTKTALDFERKPLYLVSVTASDGQLTDTITVIIRLIDLADTEFVSVSLPLSERTPQVRDAIVENVVVANNLIETPAIDEITDAQIAAISALNLRDTGITRLKTGDFSGMPNLSDINLHGNKLTGLTAGIFEGLTALTTLRLGNNLLNPMPIFVSIQQVDTNQFQVIVPTGAPFDIVVPIIVTDGNISGDTTTVTVQKGTLKSETFTIVPTGETPIMDIGKLADIPLNHYGYVLARSTACNRTPEVVTAIEAMYPLLMHCQNVADVDLAVITNLNLVDMRIKSLRTHDFSGMLALTTLYLNNNELAHLPEDIFDGLLSLKTVSLRGNKLTYLPDGIFEGFVSLESLDLSGNAVDPLTLTLSLEKVDEDGFKAVIPTGAPFDISLTLTTTNGTISDSIDTITIPQGSVESDTYTVTRTPDTIDAVTVDISELPHIPSLHAGYELVKSDALPLEIFPLINVAPIFTQTTPTTYSVPENTEEGINIGTAFTALDANNDRLTYTLGGEDADAFEVDPETGQLTTKEDLDFETKSTYTVIVSATDGDTIASISVTIIITDVNENRASMFTEGSSTTRNVEENTEIGENIGDPVVATDPDDDTLTYSLEGTDAALFSIDNTTGQLRTGSPLDYETKSSYSVKVTAFDGELTANIDVIINVIDVEENPPVFAQGTTTTITITTKLETEAAIAATDADGDTLTYSISGDDAELFDIDPNTGELKVKEGVTLELGETYMVTVTVSDGTHNTIIDVNINISDKDETVVNKDDDKPTNQGSGETGQNDDGTPQRAGETDQGTQTPNNAPVFTEGSTTTRSVEENTEIGENIGDAVTATDADNDTLIYTLGGTDAGSFSVDNNTGQLQTSIALDYETQSIYSVTITVTDGKVTDRIDVTINVTDIDETAQTQPPPQSNRTPVFSEGTNTRRSVTENTTAGTNIGDAVVATDPDDDTLTYSLAGTDDALFSIDSTTGQLKTEAPLDYETNNSYAVIITASDGERTASIDVVINIIDVEENPPVFTQGTTTTITITTEAETETTEGTITATDPDGDTLTYSLSGDDAELFDIDPETGELGVKEGVTLDPDKTYKVRVTVSDGTHITSIDVIVNISDKDETVVNKDDDKPTNQGSGETGQNDDGTPQRAGETDQGTQTPNNAPVFTEGTTAVRYVAENTQVRTNVGTPVSATDQDTGDTLTYRIGINSDAAAFTIVPNTGQLRTGIVLDYETKASYLITVIVSDEEASDTIGITINVTNDNDPPVFTPGYRTSIDVAETVAIGREIGTYTATDQDTSDTLIYSLSSNNSTDHNAFEIGRDDGILKTSSTLDYETKTLYALIISVSDGNNGTDSITVTINVTDVPEIIDPPISSRTPAVRDAIVAAAGVATDDDVTPEDLAKIRDLDLNRRDRRAITSLSAGDFNGLTRLRKLDLGYNDFTSLPEGIFDELPALETLFMRYGSVSSLPPGLFDNTTALELLSLDNNDLSSLPPGLFDNLTKLRMLILANNDLSALPPGLFDNLTNLKQLLLYDNDLSSLPSDIFDNLTNLEELRLGNNDLSSLPSDIFDDLTNLEELRLGNNDLSSLPPGLFDNLTNLEELRLGNNDLSSLPPDIFDNLAKLVYLDLDHNDLSSLPSGIFNNLVKLQLLYLEHNRLSSLPPGTCNGLFDLLGLWLLGNLVDPMLFTVSLEKVEDGKVKAVIPLGAPYDVVVYIKLEHGTNPDPKVLRISTGMNESSTFTVTRTPGTTEAVTVDIFHIVVIPAYYHTGYRFVKPSTGLPVEIYAADTGAPSLNKDATPNTTALLLNYPNPFNPETWLPYQLSKASDVTITIYNMRGVVVRRLVLGHQKAGFYRSRSRAAHWDGRNAIGEKVAAGVYFYTFKAGDWTATRKMLIRK